MHSWFVSYITYCNIKKVTLYIDLVGMCVCYLFVIKILFTKCNICKPKEFVPGMNSEIFSESFSISALNLIHYIQAGANKGSEINLWGCGQYIFTLSHTQAQAVWINRSAVWQWSSNALFVLLSYTHHSVTMIDRQTQWALLKRTSKSSVSSVPIHSSIRKGASQRRWRFAKPS